MKWIRSQDGKYLIPADRFMYVITSHRNVGGIGVFYYLEAHAPGERVTLYKIANNIRNIEWVMDQVEKFVAGFMAPVGSPGSPDTLGLSMLVIPDYVSKGETDAEAQATDAEPVEQV